MLLYHGTTLDRAKNIFKDGYISVTNDENCRYTNMGSFTTTNGYVYVSDIINIAFGYAIDTSSGTYPEGSRKYVIFRINIDESEVELDADNEDFPAIVSALYQDCDHCFRINRNLELGQDVDAYTVITIKSYQQGCNLSDNEKFPDVVNKHWQTLHKRKGGVTL